MNALEKYKQLERRRLIVKNKKEDDKLLEQLDDLWHKMTTKERNSIRVEK